MSWYGSDPELDERFREGFVSMCTSVQMFTLEVIFTLSPTNDVYVEWLALRSVYQPSRDSL